MSRSRRLRLPTRPFPRHLLFALVAAAGFYGLTSVLSDYDNYRLGEIALYAVALAGLSVLTGMNGQISLGHGALMAVGAYTTALLMTHTQLNFVVELLAAVAVTTAMGVVVGIPATRLKGPYLAGMTLILALGLPLLADKYSATFGGDQGLSTNSPTPPGSISAYEWLTWIEILGALITLLLLANLLRSRFGRSFRAVRDDEIAASLAGIHVARTKVIAFAVSAGCAGLAGAFLGVSTGVVSTGEFPLSLSIGILAGMVLGGAGSLMGVWWGAVALVYLPDWSTSISKSFSLGNGVSAYLATIIYGVVLIVVMLLAPSGIQGGLRRGASEIKAFIRRRRGDSVTDELQESEGPAMATVGSGGPEGGWSRGEGPATERTDP
ncbi:MAG TPA: branched-chain amino acid ABC transporter permease [Acidimicrobiales bacterium]|nr:branched-chain amino acid ABC transporter permease [Acidimicrobiales bacterium]